MRPFFTIKQKTAAFWAERVLLAKTGLKLQAFLMRHMHKTRIPFPHYLSTKKLLVGIHTTHWAFVHNLLLWSSRLLEEGTVSSPPKNLGVTYL
jgi:hypothetical protein